MNRSGPSPPPAKQGTQKATTSQKATVAADQGVIANFLSSCSAAAQAYKNDTPPRVRAIDIYLLHCFVTGISLFVYFLAAATYPYNSFLGAFIGCIGSFVLAGTPPSRHLMIDPSVANLRMREMAQSADKPSPARDIAEFVVATVVLHLFIANFIG